MNSEQTVTNILDNETVKPLLARVSQTTKNNYRRGLELFCEYYKKSIEEILSERKNDLIPKPNEDFVSQKQRANRFATIIESFHSWLKTEKGYPINTARVYCLGIEQLFSFYEMPIKFRRGSKVNETVIAINDFVLSPQIIRTLFHTATDLRSQLFISMANDLAWRVNDILTIKRAELPNLEHETPIYWQRITEKEKQVSRTCLSETTVKLLSTYLTEFPSHNPFLFNSNGDGHIDDRVINDRLRALAKQANIDLENKKFTSHCFRDHFISTAKNLGIDNDLIKLMCGKAISKSILPYLTALDIKKAFLKIQEVTRINGEIIEEKAKEKYENRISELENKQSVLGKAYSELSERLEQQSKTLEQITKIVSESKADLESAKTDASRALAQVIANKQEILNLLKEKERKPQA